MVLVVELEEYLNLFHFINTYQYIIFLVNNLLRFSPKFLTLIFSAFVVGVAGNYFIFKSTQYLVIIKGIIGLFICDSNKLLTLSKIS